jgi:hypothetical protein
LYEDSEYPEQTLPNEEENERNGSNNAFWNKMFFQQYLFSGPSHFASLLRLLEK